MRVSLVLAVLLEAATVFGQTSSPVPPAPGLAPSAEPAPDSAPNQASLGADTTAPTPGAAPPEAATSAAPVPAPEASAPVPASEQTPPSTDDVVEEIVPSDSPRTASAAASPSEDRFEFGGWARASSEYWFHESDPRPGRAESSSKLQLLLRGRYARGKHLELAVSGLLAHELVYDDRGWRGALEPELRDAYAGLYFPGIDVRVGQQRLAWGNTEFMSPNDVVNARDLRDPFVGEQELRFIPTPLARVDLDLDPLSWELVVAPWFVPDRYDLYGSNWAGVQSSAPADLRSVAASTIYRFDKSLFNEAQRLFQQTSVPGATYAHVVPGTRLGISVHNFDAHVYYQYGYDGPRVVISEDRTSLSATYRRHHHVGVDLATTLGPLAFRLDSAFEDRHQFFREDLISHESGLVDVAGAIEYQTGAVDKVLLVEGLYRHLLQASEVPLLAWDRNSVGTGLLARWPLFSQLHFEIRALVGIHPYTVVARPELLWKQSGWTFGVGALGITGSQPSFGWYYQDNDEVFALIKLDL